MEEDMETVIVPKGHKRLLDAIFNGCEFVEAEDEAGVKKYYLQRNVGKAKYTVNYHDGVKTHKDNSPFYDISIFKTKKKMEAFLKELSEQGYKERL
jgi:hypothetical protein